MQPFFPTAIAGAARSEPVALAGRNPASAPPLTAARIGTLLAGMVGKGHGIEAICLFLQLTRDAVLDLVVQHDLPTPHDRPRRAGGAKAWTGADYSVFIACWLACWRAGSIAEADTGRRLVQAIEEGEIAGTGDEPAAPALVALLDAFRASAEAGGDAAVCIAFGLAAAGRAPRPALDAVTASAAAGEPPQTDLQPMLAAVAEDGPGAVAATSADAAAAVSANDKRFGTLVAIETANGAAPLQARQAVTATLAVRDAALRQGREIARPAMSAAELGAKLGRLTEQLAA